MNGAIAYLMKHPDLLETLPKEMLEQLMKWVKAEKAKAFGVMPQSAVTAMTDVVDDKLMQDIVQDLRKLPDRGGFLPSKIGTGSGTAVPQKGSGWQKPSELGAPAGIKYIDQALDVQDALDRRDLEKRLR